jgi:hypothetical protein
MRSCRIAGVALVHAYAQVSKLIRCCNPAEAIVFCCGVASIPSYHNRRWCSDTEGRANRPSCVNIRGRKIDTRVARGPPHCSITALSRRSGMSLRISAISPEETSVICRSGHSGVRGGGDHRGQGTVCGRACGSGALRRRGLPVQQQLIPEPASSLGTPGRCYYPGSPVGNRRCPADGSEPRMAAVMIKERGAKGCSAGSGARAGPRAGRRHCRGGRGPVHRPGQRGYRAGAAHHHPSRTVRSVPRRRPATTAIRESLCQHELWWQSVSAHRGTRRDR